MKVSKSNNKKKLIITSTIVILFVFAGYAWFSHHYQLWPFLPNAAKIVELNNSDSTNGQTKVLTTKPVSGVDNTKNSSDIPVSNTTSITIDSLIQSGDTIIYSSHITNPAKIGVCSATFTKNNSRTLVYNTTIHGSDCGLSISANDFDATGVWTMDLRYYADNVQSIATSSIEVK